MTTIEDESLYAEDVNIQPFPEDAHPVPTSCVRYSLYVVLMVLCLALIAVCAYYALLGCDVCVSGLRKVAESFPRLLWAPRAIMGRW